MWRKEKAQVAIYSRPDCHLCHVAEDIIRRSSCRNAIDITVVNIDDDPELQTRYGNDVPVVLLNGVEIFRHRVSSVELCRRVNQEKKK